jgi:hypothetical protein
MRFNRPYIRPAAPDAVPVEPPASVRAPIYIDRELVIGAFNRLALAAYQAGRMDLVDQVLDERREIRPPYMASVPVNPGWSA